MMLIERLGADLEDKTITSDAEIVDFGMTTSDSYKGIAPNQKVKKTERHSIVVFNLHFAKKAFQYLRKSSICIPSSVTA
ncbi:single-stranded DNA-binding protein [Bartonella taylorii]|uniref:single-stranded DNA-binding protein n=1 Tax=Bartonella taylorii TaxID=33046 RepID=UPI001ABACC4E|nr:single-stranded DNA-binding protein [Bartonella taylorii]